MTPWVFVYQLLLTILTPLGAVIWAIKALTDKRYREGAGERLGFWPEQKNGSIWVHAASIGEIRAVAPFIKALMDREVPVVLTTTSSTGRNEAKQLLGERGTALFLPLDHIAFLSKAFAAAKPTALIIVETELWPGLFWAASTLRVPVVIVSGRISDKTFPKYMKFRKLVGKLLNSADRILAQTRMDADRYIALGAHPDKVAVGGNMKFDIPPMPSSDPAQVSLRRMRAGGWRVLVGGSVHPGEARIVFEGVRTIEESGLKLGLVVAPRHLEKIEEIERELRETGGTPVRWSALGEPLEVSIMESFRAGKTIIVDRVGLLSRLYGGAEVAFVGGSLVPVGGHNLLEPLRWGVPVLFGQYMNNSQDIRDEVLKRGLGSTVTGPVSFSDAALGYFADEEARNRIRKDAESFFEDNRGALLNAVEAVSQAIRSRSA